MAKTPTEQCRVWRAGHPERSNELSRMHWARLKIEVLSHYSGGTPECAICGFSDIRVLEIDHIEGGGEIHRRSIRPRKGGILQWLKTNKFPEGFRVLCRNCNWIAYIEAQEASRISD